nr:MAG TPA: hypothetical protein [Caudoviricetes sp.]
MIHIYFPYNFSSFSFFILTPVQILNTYSRYPPRLCTTALGDISLFCYFYY